MPPDCRLYLQRAQDIQCAPAQFRVFVPLALNPMIQRRNDTEIHIHGLERPYGLIGDIQGQGPQGGLLWEVHRPLSAATKPEAVDST